MKEGNKLMPVVLSLAFHSAPRVSDAIFFPLISVCGFLWIVSLIVTSICLPLSGYCVSPLSGCCHVVLGFRVARFTIFLNRSEIIGKDIASHNRGTELNLTRRQWVILFYPFISVFRSHNKNIIIQLTNKYLGSLWSGVS